MSNLGLPTALKPVGIINEQNTCFLNSTFQALSATRPLISLMTWSPTSSLDPGPNLARPSFSPDRVPALQPSAFDPPLYDLLPVTRAFLNNLHKAWKGKESDEQKSISLRTLLRELARKYDQYDDFRQQDSHELLRHLLDSMEMEEKDVIKRVQPEALDLKATVPERLVSFVDVLFGGSLASIVVCDTCKSVCPSAFQLIQVSHTYEGFLDISLSLKADEPRSRKRDKLKALFRPKPKSAVSDTEVSDTEPNPPSRRQSMDDDRSEHSLGRTSSLKFVKAFRKKGRSEVSLDELPVKDVKGNTAQSAYMERILTPHEHETRDGLVESLRQFTSVELLEGDNAFACKRCWKISRDHSVQEEPDDDPGSASDEEPPTLPVGRPHPSRRKSTHFVLRRAYKRYMIASSPEILVFHLKRFRQTQKGLAFTSFYDLKKIDDFIPFPEELDLAPFMAPDRQDYKGEHPAYLDWAEGPTVAPSPYRLYGE
jgi:ubiquitin carboxyl-terminal hydrolase 16/45